MENLSRHLELVQEELLSLYEKDSDKLEDQVRQWKLISRENAILYGARKRGIMRLGMHPVPTLASSETRARQAIEMTLYLESLQRSVFAEEPWTLNETTRERFLAPPEYCFKKGGQQVEVVFDGDRNNSVSHTTWQFIYYQNGNDLWHKVPGNVEYEGLSYTEITGLKVTYLSFADEAKRYSRTGQWEVFLNNKPILPSSGTTTRPSPGRNPAQTPRATKQTPSKTSPRGVRRRGGPLLRSRGRRRSTGGGYPSPEEVGASHKTPAKRSSGRLGELLESARDPPVILLKGRANVLKCFRFTIKKKHKELCRLISTTYHWTSAEGTQRVGAARVLVVFTSPDQRAKFLKTVKIPSSITYVSLNMDDI